MLEQGDRLDCHDIEEHVDTSFILQELALVDTVVSRSIFVCDGFYDTHLL